MVVKLTYFRFSGKYYSDGEYETKVDPPLLFEIWEEVHNLKLKKTLPGLVDGADEFHILVDVPDHPHRHPHLII